MYQVNQKVKRKMFINDVCVCMMLFQSFSAQWEDGKLLIFYDVPLSFSVQSIFFFLQLPHRIYATYLATVMLYCISHFARSVFLHSSLWLCKRWLGGRKFVGWKRCVCSTIRMTDFYMYQEYFIMLYFLKFVPLNSQFCLASFLNFLP